MFCFQLFGSRESNGVAQLAEETVRGAGSNGGRYAYQVARLVGLEVSRQLIMIKC